jgi:uncharacterized damage-inducible protein DinB
MTGNIGSLEGRIEAYLEGPACLRRIVSDFGPDQLLTRPIAGKWSTLEVVCHLADSEQAWCHRMKRTIAEDRPLLIGYNETQFTASLYYDQRDLEQELRLIESMRAQMGANARAVARSGLVASRCSQ